MTVWHRIRDGALFVSTRPEGAGWKTHNTPIDMSKLSGSGRFYQGSPVSISVTVERPLDDRAVLVALYHATDGPNWSDNTNWLSDEPLSEWHGVTTDDEGRVTELWLQQNQLSGEIPRELSYLSKLEGLFLYDNQLRGTIPPELGTISTLTHLILPGNQLTGEIPPELGNLSNLEELFLSFNQLSGEIPPELGNLSKLTRLWLMYNQLSGEIPPELGNLSNLTELRLNNNQLTGCVPEALAYVSDYCGAPPVHPDDMIALATLYNATDGPNWSDNTNWLSDKPLSEWYGVTTDDEGRVTRLDLDDNQLSGTLPPELGGLANLEALWLTSNQLTGAIPPELGSLSNLTELVLWGNQLSGEIPSELGNLSNLRILDLQYNQLTGCVPEALAHVSDYCAPKPPQAADRAALVALYNATDGPNWSDNTNWLSDSPQWHGVGTDDEGRVIWVSLPDNQLHGEIPRELGNLANLEHLQLNDNQLSGEIPRELGSLSSLETLWLAENQLSGEIPRELGKLSSLRQLKINGNPMSGCVPEELLHVTDWLISDDCPTPQPTPDHAVLVAFYHATDGPNWTDNTNWLSADTPLSQWHGVTVNVEGRVVRLTLRSNQLSGEIPSELGSLSSLEMLLLSDNQLSGTIPRELGNFSNLEWLFLDGNQLSGAIPADLGNLVNLTGLWLHDNQLSGAIPPELGNLTNLDTLNLAGNQLTGCVPDALAYVSDYCAP